MSVNYQLSNSQLTHDDGVLSLEIPMCSYNQMNIQVWTIHLQLAEKINYMSAYRLANFIYYLLFQDTIYIEDSVINNQDDHHLKYVVYVCMHSPLYQALRNYKLATTRFGFLG